ncbi:MAG: GNAT family N-acetyltransferase [Alphaproteobacteria bacterium]|nr:GNAT family N-acetyltransferase [Alphaproteobacteria bacterium]MBQ6110500.1 GNAT family N-acetyltransferase [Alphaproteobacteria bacterium]
MNRAIKLKLKNGKIVTIRRLRAEDYDAVVKYYKEFNNGPSAKMVFEYPGSPVSTKEHMVNKWENKNNLCIAAFDGNKIIGCAQICKIMPDHPFSGRNAITGTTMLEKYTSNGLGTKFKQIVEKWAHENNVHKLVAETFHKNNRSVGNLLKNGYEIVGILHDVAFIDGEWYHQYNLEKILEK